jgi:hypothetical protein
MLSPIMQAKAEEQAMLFDQEVAHLEADRRVAEVLDMQAPDASAGNCAHTLTVTNGNQRCQHNTWRVATLYNR